MFGTVEHRDDRSLTGRHRKGNASGAFGRPQFSNDRAVGRPGDRDTASLVAEARFAPDLINPCNYVPKLSLLRMVPDSVRRDVIGLCRSRTELERYGDTGFECRDLQIPLPQ